MMTVSPASLRLRTLLETQDQQADRELRRHLLHASDDGYGSAIVIRPGERARRLLQSLEQADSPALRRLRQQFPRIDIATAWPQLGRICHDMALCLGMATLASKAMLDTMLAEVFDAGTTGKSMVAGLYDAGTVYRRAFLRLWGTDPSDSRFSLSDLHAPAPHPGMVAADFAHGHLLAVTAMLRTLSAGMRHGNMRRQALLNAAMRNPRLGPTFATWLTRNELALARHPSLQARTAGFDAAPAVPAVQPRAASTKGIPAATGKVARDMEILRYYAAQGNREAYWNYLAANGDPYARLALGVVRNDTLSGAIANGYAKMRAGEMKVAMTERDWDKFGVDLMRADLAYRERYLSESMSLGRIAPLPVKEISRYHRSVFTRFGLDADAWTAHIPLSPYLDAGDEAGAEKVWQTMLDERFYVTALGVSQSEARVLIDGANPAVHGKWFAKMGALASEYSSDPLQSYADADKIGNWRYEKGVWSRMHFEYPAAMDGSMGVATAPEHLRKQLDLDRLFRLERQRPLDRHPLDLTHLIPGT